jgi:bacitracin synthase 3
MDMHHTVSDGTSVGILLADLVNAYRGEPMSDDYYYSYLLAEARVPGTDEYQNAKYYFEGILGQCEWCNVPTPDYESWEADEGEERMDMGLSAAQIHAAQTRLGASGNMICIAAALLALREYCGRQDVLVNWIDHNRTDPHYENTVGMLFRILPVTVRMDRCGTVEKLLREVSRQVAMGFANSSCDFMSERESALEDTMEINYQVGVWDGDPLAALGAEEIGLRPEGQATGGRVGMYIEDWPGDTVGVVVEYQRKAYAEGSMARFLDIFRKHLRRIVTGREDTDEKD